MTVTHEIGTLVIYPKGSLHQRIIVMISAYLFTKSKGLKVLMIWDHAVPYHALFLDNISLVNIDYFGDKHYIYNPNVDQSTLIQSILPNPSSEMYMIVETDKEIVDKSLNIASYILQRKMAYQELLKNHLSGMVLGQLNMFDYPYREKLPVCFTTDTKLKEVTKNIVKLPLLKPDQFPDARNEETIEYLRALIYSKADVLLCENDTDVPKEFVYATDISLVPVVSKQKKIKTTDNHNGVATNFLNYETVINPDYNVLKLI